MIYVLSVSKGITNARPSNIGIWTHELLVRSDEEYEEFYGELFRKTIEDGKVFGQKSWNSEWMNYHVLVNDPTDVDFIERSIENIKLKYKD